MGKTKTYNINGVTIKLPLEILTPSLRKAFDSGKYEHLEARQVPRFMRDKDRLLEVGGGVGFISSLASKSFELDDCTVIEGNPGLIEVILDTHRVNNVNANVLNCIAVSPTTKTQLQPSQDGTVPFYIRKNFWGSSLSNKTNYEKIIKVPIIDFQTLIDQHKPTVIICDIEGGELNLFEEVDLSNVRSILIEVHKAEIGLAGIDRLISALSKVGLTYNPNFSVGAVILFSKED